METKYTMRPLACALAAALLGLMSGCGGGGGGAGGGSPPVSGTAPPAPPAPPVVAPVTQFTVGGTVEGLAPGAVVTLSNGNEQLPVSGNGLFTFPGKLEAGTAFSIGATPPAGYTCKVSDGVGTMANANATKSSVTCAPVVLAGVRSVLQEPTAVARDGNGNLYVLDAGPNAILKFSANGNMSVLAGAGKPGKADATGSAARFWFPTGDVVADGQGNLLVADGCNGAIRKVTPEGVVSTLAGHGTTSCYDLPPPIGGREVDGLGAGAGFERPRKIVSDGAGGAIVLDALAPKVRRVSAAGAVTSQSWADPDPYSFYGASFNTIARTSDGVLHFSGADHKIWRDTGAGTLALVAGGPGTGRLVDGIGAAARFRNISAMTAGPNGELYVGDVYAIRKVMPSGAVTTLAGGETSGLVDGSGAEVRFGIIRSMTLDGESLIVVDAHGVLRRVGLDGKVTRLAATPSTRGIVDGAGAAASITASTSLGADPDGNLYFAEPGSHVVRKVTPGGIISTIAGTARMPGTADGPLSSALFTTPHTVAAGRDGVLWVAQTKGLRRIQNGAVTTLQPLLYPTDLSLDPDGNAIITDGQNVARISSTGERTDLVTSSQIMELLRNGTVYPMPIAPVVDAAGNLYVVDPGTSAVYKRTKAGELSVFAGTPLQYGDADGPAGTGTLRTGQFPFMTIDDKGNLYLSIQGTVRMISPAGVLSSPSFDWGSATIYALAYSKGKLYGMTKHAVLQSYLP